jgi:menaquinone-9 beta-reductase
MVNRTDVVVAGGGPAGLAAAIAARRKGLDVAVFEGVASESAIDKCCGEGLMPDAIEALRQLGIVLPQSAGTPIGGIRFLDADTVAEGRFRQQTGVGVRRTALHSLLDEHARQAGVTVHRGAPVRGLAPGGVRVGDELVRCGWIVGADGSQSAMRRAGGLEQGGKHSRRFGSRRHFRIEPWSDLVEVYWADGAQAYVTPVAQDEIGVAVIASDPLLRFEDLLALFPALAARLAGAVATSRVRGAVTASRRLARVTRANLALIGDASGSVDALTGLGLSLAFQQAVALGEALEQGDLAVYSAAHQRIARVPRVMEALVLAMDRRAWFRRRAIRALAVEPEQFARLLAAHAGGMAPALRVPLALGWKFLTA